MPTRAACGADRRVTKAEPPTTAGVLALGNLQAQIDGQSREALTGHLDARGQARLIELVLLPGHVLGCIADHERADNYAEQLTDDSPTDAAIARLRPLKISSDDPVTRRSSPAF